MAPEHDPRVDGFDLDDPPDADDDPYRVLRVIVLLGIGCGLVCVAIVVYDAIRQRDQLAAAGVVPDAAEEEPPPAPVASSNGKGRRRPPVADVAAPAGSEEG